MYTVAIKNRQQVLEIVKTANEDYDAMYRLACGILLIKNKEKGQEAINTVNLLVKLYPELHEFLSGFFLATKCFDVTKRPSDE